MDEYASGQLREKVVGVICDWWKGVEEGTEPDEYLEGTAIHEELGAEVGNLDALVEVLVKLARDGDITLTIDGSGMTIYRNPRSKLCDGQEARRSR